MLTLCAGAAVHLLMENSGDACDREGAAAAFPAPESSEYRLFGRKSTIHQCMGGGFGMISTIYDHELFIILLIMNRETCWLPIPH